MELFPLMKGFYKAVAEDPRISSTHISVYMALLHHASVSGGTNPVQFKRQQIMHSAKISARHTYNRCMNELSQYGYIQYKPSVNGHSKSSVFLSVVEMRGDD